MLCRKVAAVLAVSLLSVISGMPDDNSNQDLFAGLPFLQFTNGGIRVNFGGYHAQAGLGGLLGGSSTGGGLHASAGTPWGAHAAAGLGGMTSGENGNLGGGLYARAGLGNGRPEAGAGLGGILDGSGRSGGLATGGLFAGATTRSNNGGNHSPPTGGNNPPPHGGNHEQTNKETNGGNPSKGHTNIQIISHSGKRSQKPKQSSSDTPGSSDAPKHDEPANLKAREVQSAASAHTASAGIFGSVSANSVPQASIEKVKIASGGVEGTPVAPPLPSEQVYVAQSDERPTRVRGHPKWLFRKRFLAPRKQIVIDSSVETQDNSQANTQSRSRRQAGHLTDNATARRTDDIPVVNGNDDGFFDDVFKIPISTLNAVNQFLNNNSG